MGVDGAVLERGAVNGSSDHRPVGAHVHRNQSDVPCNILTEDLTGRRTAQMDPSAWGAVSFSPVALGGAPALVVGARANVVVTVGEDVVIVIGVMVVVVVVVVVI